MEKQTPSVGRIVHFFPSGSSEPQAALVIKVWNSELVNVSACNENGTWSSYTSVQQGDAADTSRSRWNWPART
jgi:hypothetical protein